MTCCCMRALTSIAASLFLAECGQASETWPLWEAFKSHFVAAEGRVVDHDAGDRTTSEGQSYGLFFALVANDRRSFDRLLGWTECNLAAGDLTARLPAWLWERGADANWYVVDENSASDADLWLAYTLFQAGIAWQSDRYIQLGTSLANRIAAEEVATLAGFGPMVLPGPRGFQPHKDIYILNASYVPLQIIWNLAAHSPTGPWTDIALNIPKLLKGSSRSGWVLDWIAYKSGVGFESASPFRTEAKASYDAIRVYLWAGMLDERTFLRKQVVEAVSPAMVDFLRDHVNPPAQVNEKGVVEEFRSDVGFAAAVLPLLFTLNEMSSVAKQQRKLASEWEASTGLYGSNARYYDACLTLFANGWTEQKFSFDAQGALNLRWK